jgi:hypothetical protein
MNPYNTSKMTRELETGRRVGERLTALATVAPGGGEGGGDGKRFFLREESATIGGLGSAWFEASSSV